MPAHTTNGQAVYLGWFDPPTRFHRYIATVLLQDYEHVVIRPVPTLANQTRGESLPIHRAIMVDLNFGHLDRVAVDLEDFEILTYQTNLARPAESQPVRTVYIVTPSLIEGAAQGRSVLHQVWKDANQLWQNADFLLLKSPSEVIHQADLPKNVCIKPVPEHQSSAAVRKQLLERQSADELLHPAVVEYIERHGLFRLTPPAREARYRLKSTRLKLFHDQANPQAVELAARLKPFEHSEPEVIVSIGGDGTMLRAIRKHWRDRLPFIGLNVGHLGFLLNEPSKLEFWEQDLRLYQLPLLRVETTNHLGETQSSLAFNDCWVERAAGQTAWVEVRVNGEVRMPKVVCDGMLIATAAGSTSYARAMRATPLPFNAPLLTLAGSNVLKPEFWQPAVLALDSRVCIRNLDIEKRPLRGFVDGVEFGLLCELRAAVSQLAAVELLFTTEHDPVSKLAMLQFPNFG